MIKNNLNRINLILESFCNRGITPEQMADLINKYGIEEKKKNEI
jgi:hypothetical protein